MLKAGQALNRQTSALRMAPSRSTRAQLLDAMKDIIVGKAAYVGRFHQ